MATTTENQQAFLRAVRAVPQYSASSDDFILSDINKVLTSKNDDWVSGLVAAIGTIPEYSQSDSAFIVNDMKALFGIKDQDGFLSKAAAKIRETVKSGFEAIPPIQPAAPPVQAAPGQYTPMGQEYPDLLAPRKIEPPPYVPARTLGPYQPPRFGEPAEAVTTQIPISTAPELLPESVPARLQFIQTAGPPQREALAEPRPYDIGELYTSAATGQPLPERQRPPKVEPYTPFEYEGIPEQLRVARAERPTAIIAGSPAHALYQLKGGKPEEIPEVKTADEIINTELGDRERTIWELTKESFKRGDVSAQLNTSSFHTAINVLTNPGKATEAIEQYKKYKEGLVAGLTEADPLTRHDLLQSAISGLAQTAPSWLKATEKGAKMGSLSAAGFSFAGAFMPLPASLATLGGAFGFGMKAGMTEYFMEQGAGQIFDRLIEKNINPQAAALIAISGGIPYGLVETSQVKTALSAFPEMKSRLQKTFVERIIDSALSYGKNVGKENFEEVVQEGIDATANEIGNVLAGEKPDIQRRAGNIVNAMGDAALYSLPTVAAMVLPGGTASVVAEAVTRTPADIEEAEGRREAAFREEFFGKIKQARPEFEPGAKITEGGKAPTGEPQPPPPGATQTPPPAAQPEGPALPATTEAAPSVEQAQDQSSPQFDPAQQAGKIDERIKLGDQGKATVEKVVADINTARRNRTRITLEEIEQRFRRALPGKTDQEYRIMADVAAVHPVTGLPSQAHMESDLNRIRQNPKEGYELLIVSYDLDKFGNINDSKGHEEGDNVMISGQGTANQVVSEISKQYEELRKDDPDVYFMRQYHKGGDEGAIALYVPKGAVPHLLNNVIKPTHNAINKLTVTAPDGTVLPIGITMGIGRGFGVADAVLNNTKQNVGRNSIGIDESLKAEYGIQDIKEADVTADYEKHGLIKTAKPTGEKAAQTGPSAEEAAKKAREETLKEIEGMVKRAEGFVEEMEGEVAFSDAMKSVRFAMDNNIESIREAHERRMKEQKKAEPPEVKMPPGFTPKQWEKLSDKEKWDYATDYTSKPETMDQKTWDSLSPKERRELHDAIQQAAEEEKEDVARMSGALGEKLREQIFDPLLGRRSVTRKLRPQMPEEMVRYWGELKKARNALNAARNKKKADVSSEEKAYKSALADFDAKGKSLGLTPEQIQKAQVEIQQVEGAGGKGWTVNSKKFQDLRDAGKPFDELHPETQKYLNELLKSYNDPLFKGEADRQWLVDAGVAPDLSDDIEMDDLRELIGRGITSAEFERGEKATFGDVAPPEKKKPAKKSGKKRQEVREQDRAFEYDQSPSQKSSEKKKTKKQQKDTVRSQNTNKKDSVLWKNQKTKEVLDRFYADMSEYGIGMKIPRISFIEELVELTKKIGNGMYPRLKDRIERGRYTLGAVEKSTRQILLRQDLWAGICVAENETTPGKAKKMAEQMMEELYNTFGQEAETFITKMKRFAGGTKVRISIYKPDEGLPARVLAHEIGHVISWMADNPELRTWARGNILGHIATMYDYGKSYLENMPEGKGQVTKEEKAAFLKEAKEWAKKKAVELVDEIIIKELPIDPQTVSGILGQSMEDMRIKHKDLYDYIAKLSNEEKKLLAIKVLRDKMVPDELKRFSKKQEVKTGRKIFREREVSAEEVQEKFNELLREEIIRRQLIEAAVVNDELKRLTHQWKPFDENANQGYTKYRYKPEELYADAMSVFFNNPELLMEVAPTFFRGFKNYATRKSEFVNAYDALQAELLEKGKSSRWERRLDQMYEEFEARKKEQAEASEEEYAARGKNFWNRLLTSVYDERMPVINIVNQAIKNGMDIEKLQDNPVFQLERGNYITSEAAAYVYRQIPDIMRRLDEAGFNYKQLGDIALEERIAYEEGRQHIANPLGHNPAAAVDFLNSLKEKYGPEKFAALRDILNVFRANRDKYIVPQILASPMYSQELKDYVAMNPVYVTFKAMFDNAEKLGEGSPSHIVSGKIYKQTGMLYPVEQVLNATIAKDIAILKAIDRHRQWDTFKGFIYRAEREGYLDSGTITAAPYHVAGGKRIFENPPQGKALLRFEEYGKLVGYYVDKEIAKVFDPDRRPPHPIIGALMDLNWLPRQIFTQKNLGYGIFNLIRDFTRLKRNLPMPLINRMLPFGRTFTLLPAYLHSLPDALSMPFGDVPSEAALDALNRRMLITVENWHGLDEYDTETERLLAKFTDTGKWKDEVANPLIRMFTLAENLNATTEVLPKLAAKAYLEKSTSLSPAEIEGFVREYAGSPNFLRGGSDRVVMNNILLYSNAAKEGWRSDLSRWGEDPAGMTIDLIKSSILPKVLFHPIMLKAISSAINDDDPEWLKGFRDIIDGWRECIGRVSSYDRTNHIIVPLRKNEKGEWSYLRLPQDEFSRFFGGLTNKVLDGIQDKSWPYAMSDILTYAGDQIPSLSPVLEMAFFGVAPLLGGGRPIDLFRNRFAWDDDIEEAKGYRRFRAMVIYFASQYMGTMYEKGAEAAFGAAERAVRGYPYSTKIEARENWENILVSSPIVGRFFKTTTGAGEAERLERQVVEPIIIQSTRADLDLKERIAEQVRKTKGPVPESETEIAKLFIPWVWEPFKEKLEKAKAEGKTLPVFEYEAATALDRFLDIYRNMVLRRESSKAEKLLLYYASKGGPGTKQRAIDAVAELKWAENEELRKAGKPHMNKREFALYKAELGDKFLNYYNSLLETKRKMGETAPGEGR